MGASIALGYALAAGQVNHTATTTADGSFSDSAALSRPDIATTIRITAGYAGDATHAAAQATCDVGVT